MWQNVSMTWHRDVLAMADEELATKKENSGFI